MTKQEFIEKLRKKLSGLPADEVEDRLGFYCEMIDDRIEDGLTEEAAVADIGSVDGIAEQIIADIPLGKIAKERLKKQKRHLGAWEIVLLVLGSPIWLSLAIAALAVIFSLYVVLWSVIAALWSVFAALAACGVFVPLAGVVFAVTGNVLSGIAVAGVGLVCAGIAIFAFFGCILATKGIALLTKGIALGIKKCFVGKEGT